jgi:hypothetical protein
MTWKNRLPLNSVNGNKNVTQEALACLGPRLYYGGHQSKSKSKSLCDWRSVSQYVLVSSPNLGHLNRDFFFDCFSLVIFGAPSLTRGRVCHVSVLSLKSTVVSQYLQLFTYALQIYKVLNTFTKVMKYIQYIQASFSPGFVQQIMLYLLVS